ncbi:hypothetical protein BJV82DRAFT_589199 [Fennellomyces sp. T-0311]|nr:hypothetical protein BJV82DRAFT_589199 [Fennellomyces sp. T-0311]
MIKQPLISAVVSTSCGERDWEDGPAFRATISQLEAKTSSLKQGVKRILKTATACLQANQVLLRADQQFITALRETVCTEPLFTHYLDSAWDEMHAERERLQNSMQTLLIDPLQKLYDCDIKQAEHKRRRFEEESKKYYASLSKYLGGKKNESKYLAKKSRYDMMRFDYHAFLTDLHRGKKETELLYHLLTLQERQHAYFTSIAQSLDHRKPGLQHVAGLIADASREQAIVNKERLVTRKVLQDALNDVEANGSATSPTTLSESKGKFHGIRDLQSSGDRASTGRRKEGVLFATSRPLKVNSSDKPLHGVTWHKYWCVLRAGQLCEYTNWKRNPAAHREPLNLRFATVRMARNAERKFCFEVITPQLRRLYQAMSQDDMDEWVSTINNAIESVLNGAGSTVDINYNQNSRRNSIGGALVGLTTEAKRKFYRHSIGPAKRTSGFIDMNFSELLPGSLYLPTSYSSKETESTVSSPSEQSVASPAAPIPAATDSAPKRNSWVPRFLEQLYEADSANTKCADCGADKPEWCSLNLGILLCIECSGIHRSLGSHLSKVRSLILDSASYTPEVTEMLLALGNTQSNIIWDPRISADDRPTHNSPRNKKVDYIFAKYRDKAYVRPLKSKNAQTLLMEAIEIDDIVQVHHAIALGADVNAPHSSSTLTMFTAECKDEPKYITLPVLDADGEQIPDKYLKFPVPEPFVVRYPLHFALLNRQNKQDAGFIVAEFLFQNGADASVVDPHNGYPLSELVGVGYAVDDTALLYFNRKIMARGARRVWRNSIGSPPCKKKA